MQKELLLRFNNSADVYLSGPEGEPLATAGLITVDNPMVTNPANAAEARITLTEAGQAELNAMNAAAQQAAQPAVATPAPAVAAPAPAPAVATPAPAQPVAAAAQPVAAAPLDATVDQTQVGNAPVPAATPNQTVAVDKDADGKVDFEIDTGISIPKIKRGGNLANYRRESKYPFATLGEPTRDAAGEVVEAASFHVAATEKTPEPWKSLASTVSAANNRYKEKKIPEEKFIATRRKAQRDAAGNVVKGEDGKRVMVEVQVEEFVMVETMKFICRRVGAEDPRGVGARVLRIL